MYLSEVRYSLEILNIYGLNCLKCLHYPMFTEEAVKIK